MAGKAFDVAPKGRKAPFEKVFKVLRETLPEATCSLNHSSALELLIATILSAQCTDERVNKVTPDLFKKYPSAKAWVDAHLAGIEADIRSTGFYRNKAKSIQGACRLIVDRFGGNVPETMDELITLPGVARKTANVILGTWFRKNEGITVDTHVHRLARRWGLSQENDPAKIERDLMELVPRSEWTYFGHATILFGRQVCQARRPMCEGCKMWSFCPSRGPRSALSPATKKAAGSKPGRSA